MITFVDVVGSLKAHSLFCAMFVFYYANSMRERISRMAYSGRNYDQMMEGRGKWGEKGKEREEKKKGEKEERIEWRKEIKEAATA